VYSPRLFVCIAAPCVAEVERMRDVSQIEMIIASDSVSVRLRCMAE
jgi:hypothetical protein